MIPAHLSLGLIKRLKPALNLSSHIARLSTSVPLQATGNPLYEVGPYPKTEADRLRAARKYNLIPEDYQPYPEEEGMGDYPNLKPIGHYYRDWYCDYDDPYDYRHYGEVYHRDYDLLVWERDSSGEEDKCSVNPYTRFFVFFGTMAFFPLTFFLFQKYKIQINHPYKVRRFQEMESHSFENVPQPPAHH